MSTQIQGWIEHLDSLNGMTQEDQDRLMVGSFFELMRDNDFALRCNHEMKKLSSGRPTALDWNRDQRHRLHQLVFNCLGGCW